MSEKKPINSHQSDAETVRLLLRYDAESGNLFWRFRPVSLFAGTPNRTAQHAARNWNARFAGREAFTYINSLGYRVGAIWGESFLAHRICWLIHTGEWPDVIDHINGVGSDNRASNLRNTNQAGNMRNVRLRSDNSSGHSGVSWSARDKKWSARIQVQGKIIGLGHFADRSAAIASREAAQKALGFSGRHGVPCDAN